MRPASETLFGAVLVSCMLQACTLNATRLDRASAMGEAGKAATEGTLQLIDRVHRANRDLLISLVAADNKCKLPEPRLASGASAALCDPMGHGRSIKRWTTHELAPSIAVIEGIATYLGAVDAIVTHKPVDVIGELEGARQKLQTASEDLASIAGTPSLPTLSDAQSRAIHDALELISTLADEAGRVDDLRKLELGPDSAVFEASLASLAALNEAFLRRMEGELGSELALTDNELDSLAGQPPTARRDAASRQLELIELREAVPQLRARLKESVDAFGASHQTYRALLFDKHAPLTTAEQRQRAALGEARVLAALHSLASLIRAF